MVHTTEELKRLSDTVWERTRRRLDGLTDEEYRWEPVPGCWSIRTRPDGAPFVEQAPVVHPDPFTTLAWRLWHLIDMYGEDRASRWLGVPLQGEAVGLDAPDPSPPATAADALDRLDRAHARWDAHLALVDDARLGAPIGHVGGEYGDGTRAGYVLHMIDEFVHHGAEISMLRDLHRWQQPLSADPLTERAIRGDESLVADIAAVDAATSTALLGTAASFGRWALVEWLLDHGVAPATSGRTPAHVAAGSGELGLLRKLVDLGADLGARDGDFDATPLTWARFMRRDHVVAWLEGQHAPE
ncbi:MAG: DinB family protein [Ilumatobacter sp.]|uniref:DinB family protein n=1 Tax=Ilumatobacter sp. TaxID=1967498 RepID=UPI0032980345